MGQNTVSLFLNHSNSLYADHQLSISLLRVNHSCAHVTTTKHSVACVTLVSPLTELKVPFSKPLNNGNFIVELAETAKLAHSRRIEFDSVTRQS